MEKGRRKGFSENELQRLRKLGFNAIVNRLVTGFNYYSNSIEKKFQEAVHIPVKFGHRDATFISLLERETEKEFKKRVIIEHVPRMVIYRWLHTYGFPEPEEGIKIYDLDKEEYVTPGTDLKEDQRLLAEGEEKSLIFTSDSIPLTLLIDFLMRKGNFFLTDANGDPVTAQEGSAYRFELNPERISDEAFMTPMIIIANNQNSLEIPGFSPAKKLFKTKRDEEISVYLDKTYNQFVEKCRFTFDGEKVRLVNKMFRDFINFESIIP